jgi:hypothetical protein
MFLETSTTKNIGETREKNTHRDVEQDGKR